MSAIGTICLLIMACESVRQTEYSKHMFQWIKEHKETSAKYATPAELFKRQLDKLKEADGKK